MEEARGRFSGVHPAWIIVTLVIFPPLGLFLMWRSSRWPDEWTWFVLGLFFTPFWVRFLWQRPWSPIVKVALILFFLAGFFFAVYKSTNLVAAAVSSVIGLALVGAIIRAPGAQPNRAKD